MLINFNNKYLANNTESFYTILYLKICCSYKKACSNLNFKIMKNIIETASSNPQFSTLATAIETAGLTETLQGDGPFTVFAPTNEAFKKLPPEKLTELMADPEALKNILSYHVVSGKVMSADIMKLEEAETVEGTMVTIDTAQGVKVNNANVTSADLECTNGVIHVIDTVLIPK